MSITSGFFDSVSGDRRYNAQQISSIFDGIINDGVFANIGSAFSVKADTGNNLMVGIGRAWFNHSWIYNDAILPLTLEASELLLDRYDAVVIEVNHSTSVRKNDIKIVSGTPSSDPKQPTMIKTTDVHQYPLAYIHVKAGSDEITQSDITNMVGTSSCPYVTGLLQILSIDNIVSQWQDEWTRWFESVRGALDEDAAGNLYNMINPLLDGAGTLNMDALPVGTVWTWWNDNLPSEKWVFGNADIPEKNIKARQIWGAKTPDTPGRVIVDKSNDAEFNTIGKTGGEISAELYAAIGATNGDIASIGYSARKPIEGLDSYTYAIRVGSNAPVDPVNHSTVVLQPDGTDPCRLQPYIVARYIYKIK